MINNICIIPARIGSKGIYKKNIKNFCGKPLVVWSIEHALGSKYIDKVVVSTDSDEIEEIAIRNGAEVYRRSEKNALDEVHAVHAVLECLDFYECVGENVNYITMLLPTSPLRKSKYIDEAFELLINCDSVISVSGFEKPISSLRFINNNNIANPIVSVDCFEIQRQEVKKKLYEVNGSIYISTSYHLKKEISFHRGSIRAYIMPVNDSVDINTCENWELAEALFYYYNRRRYDE